MNEQNHPLIDNAGHRQPQHTGNETSRKDNPAMTEYIKWQKEIHSKLHNFDNDEESIKNKLDIVGGVNGILFELSAITIDDGKEETKTKQQKLADFYEEFEKIKEERDIIALDSKLKILKDDIKKFFEDNYKYKENL